MKKNEESFTCAGGFVFVFEYLLSLRYISLWLICDSNELLFHVFFLKAFFIIVSCFFSIIGFCICFTSNVLMI